MARSGPKRRIVHAIQRQNSIIHVFHHLIYSTHTKTSLQGPFQAFQKLLFTTVKHEWPWNLLTHEVTKFIALLACSGVRDNRGKTDK